jgi:predicted Zn-dependent protease
MTAKDKIFSLLDPIIKKSPADQTEAVVINGQAGLTRYANSTVHQNVFEVNSRIYFRVALGKKIGVAATNILSKEGLKKALEDATTIAKNQRETSDFKGLPGKSPYKKMRTYFKKTASFSPRQRAEIIKTIFEKAGKYNLTVAGAFSTGESEITVINSNGVACYQPVTSANISMTAMSDNSSGYADGLARNVDDLDFDQLAETAIRKCLDSKDPQELQPGEYTVILEPKAVAELLEWMNYIGFGAKSFQDGTSFLSGKIGQKIMGGNVSIYDDGNDDQSMAFPFDFEGVPKKKVFFVRNGVAKGVVYDTLTCVKDKTKTTGHALTPDTAERALGLNLFVKGGDSNLKKMVGATERGILITRFHYINGLIDTNNAVMTGMTRDGTFYLENGTVKHGIKNLRFTESMLKAFSNVEQLSRQRKLISSWWSDVGCITVPAMKVNNFRFTGKTSF